MDKQIKPRKIYSKVNEDVFSEVSNKSIERLGADDFSLPQLVEAFRLFLRESYLKLFEMLVKYVWLEQHITYNGVRRCKRCGNGFNPEKTFSFFFTGMVGFSAQPLMGNLMLCSLISYFKDFFPNFSDHDPFKESEYFKYPYTHVTPDFLYVVKDHHERIGMLNYAEEKKMNIREFVNWAVNQSLCYNLEIGEDIYSIARNKNFFPRIKKIKK